MTTRFQDLRRVAALSLLVGSVFVSVGVTPAAAEAGIMFRSATVGTGATLRIATPPGVTAGDLLIAAVAKHEQVGPGGAISAPPGWRLVTAAVVPDDLELATFVRIAGPAEPGGYTWETGDPDANGMILAYSGVDTADPVAGSNTGADPKNRSIRVPSFEVPVPGSVLVMAATVEGPRRNPMEPPAGFTERVEHAVHPGIAASDQPFPPGGATGERVATADRPATNIGTVLAVRPSR